MQSAPPAQSNSAKLLSCLDKPKFTHEVERSYVLYSYLPVLEMKLCSAGRPVMMLSVCGKLVRTMYSKS